MHQFSTPCNRHPINRKVYHVKIYRKHAVHSMLAIDLDVGDFVVDWMARGWFARGRKLVHIDWLPKRSSPRPLSGDLRKQFMRA